MCRAERDISRKVRNLLLGMHSTTQAKSQLQPWPHAHAREATLRNMRRSSLTLANFRHARTKARGSRTSPPSYCYAVTATVIRARTMRICRETPENNRIRGGCKRHKSQWHLDAENRILELRRLNLIDKPKAPHRVFTSALSLLPCILHIRVRKPSRHDSTSSSSPSAESRG